MYMYVYLCMYIYVCMYVCKYVFMYLCMYVCMYVGCMDERMYACVHACMHVYHIYIYIYLNTVIIRCGCFAWTHSSKQFNKSLQLCVWPIEKNYEPSINPPERFQHAKCAVVSRRESMHQHFLAHTDFWCFFPKTIVCIIKYSVFLQIFFSINSWCVSNILN